MLITTCSSRDSYFVKGADGILLLDDDEVEAVGFLQNPDDVHVYDSDVSLMNGMSDEEDDVTLPNAAGPMESLDKNTDLD